ncbi:zinc metalloproteinase nas-39-like [Haliotis cracherodii]|uniref:zinc metalloproteinase nas-39-like n=1 Tax=Haliotis cracherodii TaxID=6455 RepID=UPI0039EA60EC
MDVNAVLACLLLGVVQVSAEEPHVERLEELHGKMMTPNYPNNYSNSYEAIWELNLPVLNQAYKLVLTIDDMDIEGSPTNCFDYIKVNDQKYCGTSPKTITVNGVKNGLIIAFYSDSSETRKGFTAHYEFVEQ